MGTAPIKWTCTASSFRLRHSTDRAILAIRQSQEKKVGWGCGVEGEAVPWWFFASCTAFLASPAPVSQPAASVAAVHFQALALLAAVWLALQLWQAWQVRRVCICLVAERDLMGSDGILGKTFYKSQALPWLLRLDVSAGPQAATPRL